MIAAWTKLDSCFFTSFEIIYWLTLVTVSVCVINNLVCYAVVDMMQLTKVNDRMSEYTLNAQNATLLHMVQRHRDILQDYSHEFQKTKNNILAVKEREELLGAVYRDNRQLLFLSLLIESVCHRLHFVLVLI